MKESLEPLFATLEAIVTIAAEILTITQNQETIILHDSNHEMLGELSRHKQEKILKLVQLENQFEAIYRKNKEQITDKEDIGQLQSLVSTILETKQEITKSEEKNRRLWGGDTLSKVKAVSSPKPQSYVIDQYKKYNKS